MDDEGPGWASEPVVRAVLAFAGVPGIILALAGLYVVTQDISKVDALSRVLQGAMLAIIGFYFGRVGAGRAERLAASVKSRAAVASQEAAEAMRAFRDVRERGEYADQILQIVENDPELRQKIDELTRDMRGG